MRRAGGRPARAVHLYIGPPGVSSLLPVISFHFSGAEFQRSPRATSGGADIIDCCLPLGVPLYLYVFLDARQ